MKKLSLPLLLILLVLTFNIQNLLAQTTNEYLSASSGDWETPSNWQTRSGFASPPPPHDAMNQASVVIVEHNITLFDDFSGNNEIVFHIRQGATLTIKGNFDVGNKVQINVEEGSHFVVEGFVDLSPSNSSNNLGVLAVNGTITINDGLRGNGVLEGSGSAYITGNITGIAYSGFTGDIIVDGTNINNPIVATPTNLDATVTDLRVSLTWNNTISSVANYSFYGYQVYRNMGGSGDNFQLISTVVGDIRSFTDNFVYETGSVPKYTIRAAYRHNTNPADFIYSAYSNVVDFSLSPLPIELLYFRAKVVGENVEFSWSTLTEINNDYFTIETSTDGRNWSAVAYITGAGTHNGILQYQTSVPVEYHGIVYYRLKQTDFDGQFEYFTPVVVNQVKNTQSMELVNLRAEYGTLQIHLLNPTEQSVLIVSDMQGRLLGNFTIQPDNFIQHIEIVLPNGTNGKMLFIRMANSGASVESKTLVR